MFERFRKNRQCRKVPRRITRGQICAVDSSLDEILTEEQLAEWNRIMSNLAKEMNKPYQIAMKFQEKLAEAARAEVLRICDREFDWKEKYTNDDLLELSNLAADPNSPEHPFVDAFEWAEKLGVEIPDEIVASEDEEVEYGRIWTAARTTRASDKLDLLLDHFGIKNPEQD